MQKTPEEILQIVANLVTVIAPAVSLVIGIYQWHKSRPPYTGRSRTFAFLSRNWGILTATFLWAATLITARLNQHSVDMFAFLVLALFIIPSHERGVAILKRNSITRRRDLLRHVLVVYLGYNLFIVLGCVLIIVLNPSLENHQALIMMPGHLQDLARTLLPWAVSTAVITPATWYFIHVNIDDIQLNSRIKRLRGQLTTEQRA